MAEKSKQVTKGLSIAKQRVLEGAGRSENTSEPKAITEYAERMEESRMLLKGVYKNSKVLLSSGEQHGADLRHTLGSIHELSMQINDPLGGAVRKVLEIETVLENMRDSLLNEYKVKFQAPLEQFVKSDVNTIRQQKKAFFDPLRVQYDAELTRRKGKVEISPAEEAEFQAQKETFEQAVIETQDNLVSLDERKDIEVLTHLLLVTQSQFSFFKAGYEYMMKMQPVVSELEQVLLHHRTQHAKADADREAQRNERMKEKEPVSEETRVFGKTLIEILAKENKSSSQDIPSLVESVTHQLQEKGSLKEEGIFRLSGLSSQIQKLRQRVDRKQTVDYAQQDPHVLTGLLKLYLRELPEPLCTDALFSSFLETATIRDRKERVQATKILLDQMPQSNRALLQHLMKLLHT
eukprot:TRINITY_DN4099_c0_g2_i1.p1 TRINITY_DN4099_c0_g2~~TRINITY_DN4099_c0_g2_i1.p1  ORF type:complete len:436 (+),score=121.16 TRINITY_DN4099_c0_g2_i1:90-1310(+)